MAIFHASLRTFSRAKGQSSVAAAAYRIGGALRDDRTGEWHNFSRKRGVLGFHSHAPSDAPAWATNATELWSRVEQSENRRNSCVARELIVALPSELPDLRREVLACAIAQWFVDRYAVAVLTALHAPDKKGDDRNFHAHLLMTTRKITSTGFANKVRVLDDQKTGRLELRAIRTMVASLTNGALAEAGLTARVDHRSFKSRAEAAMEAGDYVAAATLAREPTRHEGQAVTAEKRRGRTLAPARHNAARIRRNAQRRIEIAAHLSRPTPQPHAVRRSRIRVGVAGGSGAMRASRAQGRGARVLNEQAETLRQTLRVEAELAEAYRQQLAKTISDQPPKLIQPQAEPNAPTDQRQVAARVEPAREVVNVEPPKKRKGLSRREWAQHRRRQRNAQQHASDPAPPSPNKKRRPRIR